MSGLGNVFQHWIDFQGNKYFPTYNTFYGEFIRQIQTPNGECFDCSMGDSFHKKMNELGFIENKDHLFECWQKEFFAKMEYVIPGSENGKANKPELVTEYYKHYLG
jgi:hypothetical protein